MARFVKNLLILLAGAVVIVVGYRIAMERGASSTDGSRTLTFVMAHKPDNADNVALIEEFAQKVKERTDGAVLIQPVDPKYGDTDYDNPKTRYTLGLNEVNDGEAFMSQASIQTFAELYPALEPLNALNGPKVFRDHTHAASVLDGAIGDDLRAVVSEGSGGKLRGLSFTYSGGYRDIFTTKPVSSLADLKDMDMSNVGEMTNQFMSGLGVNVHIDIAPRSSAWKQGLLNGDLQADETELIRIEAYRTEYPEIFAKIKTIIETEHNMFLTLLVVNGPMFDSLTPDQQAVITEEARELALKERELSIKQADAARAGFIRDGITVLELAESDEARLSSNAEQVRAQQSILGDWFDRILATK